MFNKTVAQIASFYKFILIRILRMSLLIWLLKKWEIQTHHISLCYTNELHRFNLFNFSDGVRRGKEVYQRIINKFDGKEAFIRGYMTNSSAFNFQYIIMPDMGVNIDEEEDMNAMHKAGKSQDCDWHRSM